MSKHASTTLRSDWAQAFIDLLGAGFLVKFYDGTQPANVAASLSGNTLLATLTADSTPASETSGVITFDTANFSQDNSAHVTGAATWVSMQKSDGTRVYEFAISGDGHTLTGTITADVDVTAGSWSWTAPDA